MKVKLKVAKHSGNDEKQEITGLSANNSDSEPISKFGQANTGLGDEFGGNKCFVQSGGSGRVVWAGTTGVSVGQN